MENIDFDNLKKQLTKTFLENSEEIINKVQLPLDKLRANPDDEESYNNLINAFHSLKGSGSTYGFDVISALGKDMEYLLKSAKGSVRKPVSGLIGLLDKAAGFLKDFFQSDESSRQLMNNQHPVFQAIRNWGK